MRIAIGSDHAGFAMKELVRITLLDLGHEVVDFGTDNGQDSVDYPDFGAAVGRAVVNGEAELGVCTCGTGIGISMAANKIPGVRAAVIHDVTTATLARQHNHANVVCLGARTVGSSVAVDALMAFLTTAPLHGRHDRRIAQLAELDEGLMSAGHKENEGAE
jgi:ribose 5-phosphate isomerase B